jgi:hypothetical protein
VSSIYADWERGDFRSAEWAHPEIEFVIVDGPEPGSWSGLAGLVEGSRAIFAAWEEHRAEPDEFRELDGERVLVLRHLSGRGKLSGVELDELGSMGASLFHLRGGRASRLITYWDRGRALTDLGLAPEEGSA